MQTLLVAFFTTLILWWLWLTIKTSIITPWEIVFLILIFVLSVYEEIVELIRKHWGFHHVLLTPIRILFNVITWPKYIEVAVIKMSFRMGTAGATPRGRVIIIIGMLFWLSILRFLQYIYAVYPKIMPVSDQGKWRQALLVGVLVYLGRAIIGGYVENADSWQRFNVNYIKPIRTHYYKELTFLLITAAFVLFYELTGLDI